MCLWVRSYLGFLNQVMPMTGEAEEPERKRACKERVCVQAFFLSSKVLKHGHMHAYMYIYIYISYIPIDISSTLPGRCCEEELAHGLRGCSRGHVHSCIEHNLLTTSRTCVVRKQKGIQKQR